MLGSLTKCDGGLLLNFVYLGYYVSGLKSTQIFVEFVEIFYNINESAKKRYAQTTSENITSRLCSLLLQQPSFNLFSFSNSASSITKTNNSTSIPWQARTIAWRTSGRRHTTTQNKPHLIVNRFYTGAALSCCQVNSNHLGKGRFTSARSTWFAKATCPNGAAAARLKIVYSPRSSNLNT